MSETPFKMPKNPTGPFAVPEDFFKKNFKKVEVVPPPSPETSPDSIPLTKALEIMGGKERVIGLPEDYQKAFGFTPELPPIPFTTEEIKHHEKLGHLLYFEPSHTPEGEPLTIAKMAELAGSNIIVTNSDGTKEYRLWKNQFDDNGNIKDKAWFSKQTALLSETPTGTWKFVSKEIIPGSEGKNYIDQTDFLINDLKTNIFPTGLPQEYQEAITIWERDKANIQQLITDGKHLEAVKALSQQPISKLTRENLASALCRLIVLQKSRDEKTLKNKRTWTYSFSSHGGLVDLGCFAADGADVVRRAPAYDWTSVGVVFSRMKI